MITKVDIEMAMETTANMKMVRTKNRSAKKTKKKRLIFQESQ